MGRRVLVRQERKHSRQEEWHKQSSEVCYVWKGQVLVEKHNQRLGRMLKEGTGQVRPTTKL